jgi:hypothetical protein
MRIMSSLPDVDELRDLIRQLVLQELAVLRAHDQSQPPIAAPGAGGQGHGNSSWTNGAARRAAIRRDSSAGPLQQAGPDRVPAGENGIDVQAGVLTEKAIKGLPRTVRTIRLGEAAVVTPSARDLARKLGIHIERTRP